MLNTQPKRRSLLSRILNPKYIMVYSTIAVFLVIYIVGAIAYGSKGFTTLRTFLLLFSDNAYIGISAVGMTMVLITGGIDLSVARGGLAHGHVHRLWQQHSGHRSLRLHRLLHRGGRGPGPSDGRDHPLPERAALHHHADGHVPGARRLLADQPRIDPHLQRGHRRAGGLEDHLLPSGGRPVGEDQARGLPSTSACFCSWP